MFSHNLQHMTSFYCTKHCLGSRNLLAMGTKQDRPKGRELKSLKSAKKGQATIKPLNILTCVRKSTSLIHMLSDPRYVPIMGQEVQCIEVMIQTTNLLRFFCDRGRNRVSQTPTLRLQSKSSIVTAMHWNLWLTMILHKNGVHFLSRFSSIRPLDRNYI